MAFGDIIQETGYIEASSTSVTASFTGTPVEGNLIIAAHYCDKIDAGTPNNFNSAQFMENTPNTDSGRVSWKIAGSGETKDVVSGSTTSGYHTLYIVEVEGPWNASPVDQTDVDGPNVPPSSDEQVCGPVTTTFADEFLFAFVAGEQVSPFVSWSDSFTEPSGADTGDQGGGAKEQSAAYRVVTGTGTYSTTATVDSGVYDSMGALVTFKQQAAGGVLLDTASISAAGQALALVQGEATTLLDVAGIVAAGQSLVLSKGEATTLLDVANIIAGGQVLALAPGEATTLLDVANIIAAGQVITAGSAIAPIIIGLDTA